MYTDAERINWIEKCHGLHCEMQITYVVTGYTVEIVHDRNSIFDRSYFGKTLREAIDNSMDEEKDEKV